MRTSSAAVFLLILFFSPKLAAPLILSATREPIHSLHARNGATFASKPVDAASASTLGNVPGRYVSNITVNGQTFRVAIDTGSSDLWIVPLSGFEFNNTGTEATISYSSSTFASGPVGFGSVELGGYTFPEQAFINATDVTLGGIVSLGLDGLIGFAFDGATPSAITAALQKTGSSSSAGQPFLFNIFNQSPNTDNFIGISLSRTGDLEGSADASFTINEFDETYAAVANSPAIPIFPPSNARWTLLLDYVNIDGNAVLIPASAVPTTPTGKLTILMDTGTPTATVPTDLFNTIYSTIPGSVFSSSQGNWVIPCNTTTILTVVIGGQSFPIHPLDLSDVNVIDGFTVCTATIEPSAGNAGFDALFGDSIMRNIYSVFNFGSAIAKSPTPASSMQLLSQTNATTAIADVINVRMAQLASGPAEGIPPSFAPLTYMDSPPGGSIAAADLGSSSTGTNSDSQASKYAPIIIGLLGATLLVTLILAVIGVAMCVKRGGKITTKSPRYAPVKIVEEEPRKSESYEDKRYSD
ncbi:aspartic peptidase domain-containing protein, partial [Mycena galericulata]